MMFRVRAGSMAVVVTAILTACSSNQLRAVPGGPLPGSGAVYATATREDASAPVDFVVALPLRNEPELKALLRDISDPQSANYQRFLTRAEFARRFAPRPSDLQNLGEELARGGMSVTLGTQSVAAHGTVADVERLFATHVQVRSYTDARNVTTDQPFAAGPIVLSAHMKSLGATVIGLSGIPPAHTFGRQVAMPAGREPHNYYSAYGPYDTPDLRQAYRFPSTQVADGSGVTMGVVIDSPIALADTDFYAKANLKQPSLHINVQKIHGGGRWNPNGDSGEAMLDVEQSAGIAQGATAVVFDIPNLSDANIYLAYETVNQNRAVTIVNSSFGQCEADFNSASGIKELDSFDQVLEAGLAVGVTWVAASGDNAAFNCPDTTLNKTGVDWPAVDPNVVGVGGTNLTTAYAKGSNNSAYVSQSAYTDTLSGGSYWGSGGGYSILYARPSWQDGFDKYKGRGVPDLALHMGGCPEGATKCNKNDSSDWLRMSGKWYGYIGTSAASPDIVGLIAIRTQLQHKAQGDIHPWIYAHPSVFRSNIPGNNGYKSPTGKWSAVLGLGTPYANAFAGSSSVAGIPFSASNP